MFTPFAFVKQAVAAAAPAPSYPLTTAFLAATGITGSANITALQDFETGLTTYGLNSKMTAVYPLMGGNSTTTAYNFMNTSLYTITWSGNLTYYIDGVQSTGYGNGQGDSGIAGNQFSVSEGHTMVWVNTNESPGTWNGINYPREYGLAGDVSNPNLTQYYGQMYGANGLTIAYPCNAATSAGDGSIINGGNTDARGKWITSRISAGYLATYRNGSSYGTNTVTLTGRSYSSGFGPFTILNGGGAYSPRRIGFCTVGAGTGTGLTSTDATNLYNMVNSFNTTAGR